MSNKGGVGKTHLAVNIAIHCAREGNRVLLVDADLGSANADIRLGARPRATLLDFYERRAEIFDCLSPTSYGIHFLAGCNGDFALANLGHQEKIRLLRGFDRLVKRGGYTHIFFDLGAGIGTRVLDFALVTDECVIVATPADIVSAYAALKACWVRYGNLCQMHYFKDHTRAKEIFTDATTIHQPSGLRIGFLLNQVNSLEEGKRVYFRILDVARTFFQAPEEMPPLRIRYIGGIPYVHGLLRESERNKLPAIVMYPYHPFSHAIREVSEVLLEKHTLAPNHLAIPFTDRVRDVIRTLVS
jgi:MinD-like ATPase involved in chromosome partitioning or flagellar assembly